MKTHTIKTILLSAIISCCMVSCELQEMVYDKINTDIFPKTEEDIKAMLTANAYHAFSSWGAGIFGVASGYVTTSEMVTDYGENTWGWTILYNSFEANDWHIDGEWRRVYDYSSYISSMTLTMDRIKAVEIPEERMNRYMAELKCGRGFLAFLMYDMYGPIVIADLESLKDPIKNVILPRLSEEEMQDFIVTNLKEAAEVLPYEYTDSDYGRFTKGLANTVLLKFYMLTKQWDEAEKMGRELMKAEYGYELVDDYHSLFTLSGEKNTETIFASTCKTGVMENAWHAHARTADFPTPQGQVITKWGGFKVAWPAYDTFEAKDKRREKLYGEYTGTEGIIHNRFNDRDNGTQGALYKGAVPVKYDFEGVLGEDSEIDMPIYRYADVLTLLSEAIVRKSDAVTQEAVDLLNNVRTRAGLTPYTLTDLRFTDVFYEKLLEERGHEFYYEGVRRQDLIRHGKFIEAAIQKAQFAGQPTEKISTMVDGMYKYEKFPLPTHVINEGKGIIKQNPGY